MTTTKTQKKSDSPQTSKPNELGVAREIHTLTQLLYREIATIHPWVTPPSPLQSFEATRAWFPFAPGVGADPSVPAHGPW